jgi:hypothetical protein
MLRRANSPATVLVDKRELPTLRGTAAIAEGPDNIGRNAAIRPERFNLWRIPVKGELDVEAALATFGIPSILSHRLKSGTRRADIQGRLRIVPIDKFGPQKTRNDDVRIFAVDGGCFVVEVDAYTDPAQAEERQDPCDHHQDEAQRAGASHDRGRACGGYGGHMPRLAVRRAVGSVGHSGALLYLQPGRWAVCLGRRREQ